MSVLNETAAVFDDVRKAIAEHEQTGFWGNDAQLVEAHASANRKKSCGGCHLLRSAQKIAESEGCWTDQAGHRNESDALPL